MARLYKRKDKHGRPSRYWWYQFKGKRYSTQCTDRKAAELVAREIERRVADPTYRPANETTLGACLTDYVEDRQRAGRKPPTLRMIGVHVRHLARILGSDTPIAQIGAAELDKYIAQRHAEGAERSTQSKERSTLHGALARARRLKLYPHALDEVFGEFSIKYVPVKRKLTEPELAKLLAVLPPDRAAVCAFVVATSADHPSSCDAALPEDIDLEAWRVVVRGTKNAYRARTVAVVLPLFRKLLKMAAPFVPFRPWGNAVRDLRAACRRAGVPEVTPRDLRRTHGSILRLRGVPAELVADGMGHADSIMVERIYANLDTGNVETLVKRSLGMPTGTPRGHKPKRTSRKSGKRSRKTDD